MMNCDSMIKSDLVYNNTNVADNKIIIASRYSTAAINHNKFYQ